jgi:hypothetical protein
MNEQQNLNRRRNFRREVWKRKDKYAYRKSNKRYVSTQFEMYISTQPACIASNVYSVQSWIDCCEQRQLRMEIQEVRNRLENELTQLKKKMENDVRARLELASDREQALLEVQRLRKAVERERKKREDLELQHDKIQSKMDKVCCWALFIPIVCVCV